MLKVIAYIRYFFFIALNWNVPLAAFTLYHEIKGERKYHLDTTGVNQLSEFDVSDSDIKHAEVYQGAGYYQLEHVLKFLRSQGSDSLIDFGSGKGRVLAVAAEYGYKHIIGIEFIKELYNASEQNLQFTWKKKPDANIEIVNNNVVRYQIPSDVTTFFFFNPFDETIMKQVLGKIRGSLLASPRKIFIAYLNPEHKELFVQAGFKEVYHLQKLHYVHASVLTNMA